MKINNVDEATRICQEIRQLLSAKIITKKQAILAIKKVEYYKTLID